MGLEKIRGQVQNHKYLIWSWLTCLSPRNKGATYDGKLTEMFGYMELLILVGQEHERSK